MCIRDRCTSVGFHTRPEAVKYPSMTDESAMHGRLMLVTAMYALDRRKYRRGGDTVRCV